MRRHHFGVGGLAAVVVFLLGSGIALAQVPPSSIQIFMPSGAMPPGVIRLSLVRDDGYVDTVFTDSKGRFDIPSRTANYTITVESDKLTYDTTTAILSIQGNTPTYLPIFLKPLTGSRSPTSEVLDITNFEGNVPKKASAAYLRAMEAVSIGRFENAIGDLQQAISLYPEYVRAYNDLGVLFMKRDRLDEAAATFRKAIGISKRFFHPRMNLGLVLNRQAKFKEAVAVLGPLYQENHGMMEVRLAYGDALSGAGEVVPAEKVYRTALESKTLESLTRASLHFKVGLGLNRQRKFTDAVSELEKAIDLDPDVANSHLQLGGALLQLQQLERAELELLRAYELSGRSSGAAQLLLGHVYYAQKKFPEAQRAFEQYLKDQPSAPNASEITQLIAGLKAASKK